MPELSPAEFEVIATLLRAKPDDKATRAARMVLLEGAEIKDAVSAIGMLQPAVSRTVRRYREKHALILTGYKSCSDLHK